MTSGVLVAPDLQRSYAVSADWLELLALARPAQFSTDGDILQPNDILEDRSAALPEGTAGVVDEDPDIIDVGAEPMLDAIFDELASRSKVLGAAYPFELKIQGAKLRLTVAGASGDTLVEQGREIYLACLYMSAVRIGSVDAKAGRFGSELIGNLFQICATIAAAGYLHGDAYWFGHPRPDRTNMMEAIGTLVRHLQQGAVAHRPPPGETKFAKDGGVDVVAWRPHHDGRPAKIVLYGQCASGMNWVGKTVSGKVDRLDGYYSERPSRWWLPALLTPFPLYMDKENSNALKSEEARHGFYRQTESEMGIIIDRVRIVLWSIEGLRHPQPVMADAVSRLSELFAWSHAARDAAKMPA